METSYYIPNFIASNPKNPYKQQWELDLIYFKNKRQPLQLEWKEAKPIFTKFKSTTADKIALAIRPVCFGINFILAALLLAFNNFSSFWWWLGAVAITPLLLIFSLKTIKQCIYELKVKLHCANIPDFISVETRDGTPGAGKTSSLLHDFKVLADISWQKICNKYRLLEPYLLEISHWPRKEREDAEEIIEAYNFYTNSETYPCLWTSVPCFIDGIPANQLTADHLMQRKRLPYGSVMVLDETSLILPQELFRDKPTEILEMCKFPRHFGDFKIGSTEQDEDSNLIYLRRVSGRTLHMLKQEWIEKPKFLQWLYNKQLSKVQVMTKKKTSYFMCFDKIIKAMGYRKYYYTESYGALMPANSINTFYLKPNLNIEYDSRAYKNAYRCKDEELVESTWQYLRLSNEDISKIFTKELQERAKSKAQVKREAAERRRKKSA